MTLILRSLFFSWIKFTGHDSLYDILFLFQTKSKIIPNEYVFLIKLCNFIRKNI